MDVLSFFFTIVMLLRGLGGDAMIEAPDCMSGTLGDQTTVAVFFPGFEEDEVPYASAGTVVLGDGADIRLVAVDAVAGGLVATYIGRGISC